MTTRKTTLILGAGASVDYGYPLASDLINNLKELIKDEIYLPIKPSKSSIYGAKKCLSFSDIKCFTGKTDKGRFTTGSSDNYYLRGEELAPEKSYGKYILKDICNHPNIYKEDPLSDVLIKEFENLIAFVTFLNNSCENNTLEPNIDKQLREMNDESLKRIGARAIAYSLLKSKQEPKHDWYRTLINFFGDQAKPDKIR